MYIKTCKRKETTNRVNDTRQLHIWNNSNVSKVNYQRIARRPPVCAVYISKIMHNGVKAGQLQIDQDSSDTVIFAVPKKHFNFYLSVN